MHDAWVVAIPLGLLIGYALMPAKAKWHPFGGVFKHDKRTGQLTVAVTLPGRGKRKSKAKRGKR